MRRIKLFFARPDISLAELTAVFIAIGFFQAGGVWGLLIGFSLVVLADWWSKRTVRRDRDSRLAQARAELEAELREEARRRDRWRNVYQATHREKLELELFEELVQRRSRNNEGA